MKSLAEALKGKTKMGSSMGPMSSKAIVDAIRKKMNKGGMVDCYSDGGEVESSDESHNDMDSDLDDFLSVDHENEEVVDDVMARRKKILARVMGAL